tara:strand:- start:910 stop:1203 length:294 start_codon:yes stop_codon:yes gene_type:complete
MNRSEIIEKLQQKYPKLKLEEIELIFNILIKKISDSLKEGKNIEIRGFGTITKKTNKEKYVRNPKTNEKIYKNQTFKLHFKIGKTLHKRLNELSNNE